VLDAPSAGDVEAIRLDAGASRRQNGSEIAESSARRATAPPPAEAGPAPATRRCERLFRIAGALS
jgi:hypothetical protein